MTKLNIGDNCFFHIWGETNLREGVVTEISITPPDENGETTWYSVTQVDRNYRLCEVFATKKEIAEHVQSKLRDKMPEIEGAVYLAERNLQLARTTLSSMSFILVYC